MNEPNVIPFRQIANITPPKEKNPMSKGYVKVLKLYHGDHMLIK